MVIMDGYDEYENGGDYNHYDGGNDSDDYYVSNNRLIHRNNKDLAIAASGGGDQCCAHVVSSKVFLAVLAGLAIATYFIRQAITMNLGRRRRKRQVNNMEKYFLFIAAG